MSRFSSNDQQDLVKDGNEDCQDYYRYVTSCFTIVPLNDGNSIPIYHHFLMIIYLTNIGTTVMIISRSRNLKFLPTNFAMIY